LVVVAVGALGWVTVGRLQPAPAPEAVLVDPDTYETRPVTAVHGLDTGAVSADGDVYVLCDHEADENRVRAEVDLGTPGDIEQMTVDKLSGAKACTAVPLDSEVMRHRVCEFNNLLWDCDNWQVVTPPL
jgi:hypothetical protein